MCPIPFERLALTKGRNVLNLLQAKNSEAAVDHDDDEETLDCDCSDAFRSDGDETSELDWTLRRRDEAVAVSNC
jgi:hypothetical protein